MRISKISMVVLPLVLTCTAKAGFYAEVVGGYMPQSLNLSVTNDNTNENQEFLDEEKSSISYGGRLGFELTKNIALEAGYLDNGVATFGEDNELFVEPGNIRSNSIRVAVKGILPLSDSFSLNVKGGWAIWKSWNDEIPRDGSEEAEDSEENGQNPYFGAGADFSLNENISFGAEYSRLVMTINEEVEGFDFTTHLVHSVDNFSLHLKFSM